MNDAIEYAIGKADKAAIATHLRACDDSYIPPLSQRVNIDSYALKIVYKAQLFEAWANNELLGLIAAYYSDPDKITAFITNVSILPNWRSEGIAQRLMENCIANTLELGFAQIELEVNPSNKAAISLYGKHGFIAIRRPDSLLKMMLDLKRGNK